MSYWFYNFVSLWNVFGLQPKCCKQCLLYNHAGMQLLHVHVANFQEGATCSWLSIIVYETIPPSFPRFLFIYAFVKPSGSEIACNSVLVVPINTVPQCKTEICVFDMSLLDLSCLNRAFMLFTAYLLSDTF